VPQSCAHRMMSPMVPTNTSRSNTGAGPGQERLGPVQPDASRRAVGLAHQPVLNERTDLHIRVAERVTWGNATAVETLNNFTQRCRAWRRRADAMKHCRRSCIARPW